MRDKKQPNGIIKYHSITAIISIVNIDKRKIEISNIIYKNMKQGIRLWLLLGTYYAHHKTPAILSQNKDREIGRVFAEYKDKLIIVDGEVKK
jgi:hypothetical protein